MELMYRSIRISLFSIFALFLLFTFSFLLPQTSFAQTTATNSATTTPNYQYQSPNFSPQSPHSASLAIYNFGHAMSCLLIGQSPLAPCLEYKIYKDTQGVIKSTPYLSNVNTNSGLLGMSISMVGEVISTPPIRSSEFIADLGEQLGIKSANAQVGGSGGGVLAAIFKLWEVSRNIAYLVMILIFVLVGLMVMFRQKLNPQTVVSIQLALPGLVIGLVMITFSYFLASLISDLAFVGTNVVGYYFSLAQGGIPPTQLPLQNRPGSSKAGQEQNVISIFAKNTGIVKTGDVNAVVDSVWDDLTGDAKWYISLMTGFFIGNFVTQQTEFFKIAPTFGSVIQAILGLGGTLAGAAAQTFWISFSIAFIAFFALLYSMFKLLLRLINSYLNIVFLTISAPFYFLAASIPGRQSLATTWMFNMLCNVLAFPATFAVFYFVAYILGQTNDPLFNVSSGTAFVGTSTFPLLGGISLNFINILLAFGALMASASIPDAICKVVGRPGAAGSILAGAISGGIGSGQKYSGQFSQGTGGFSRSLAGGRQLFGTPGHTYDPGSGEWTKSASHLEGARPGGLDFTPKWLPGGARLRSLSVKLNKKMYPPNASSGVT